MAHKCEWCSLSVSELETLHDEYDQQERTIDSEIESLGGSLGCAQENCGRVADLNSRAAGMADDRAYMRKCIEARTQL